MDLESIRFLYLRRVVGTALSAIGLSASHRLACFVAGHIHRLNTVGRRRAELRLSDALSADASSRNHDIIAASYDHMARFWVEALFASRKLRPSCWRRSIAIKNEAVLTALASRGSGCLLATAYFGNPAFCAFALGEIFRPVHVIADRFALPMLRAWQNVLFAYPNIRIIDRRDAAKALPEILGQKSAVLMIAEHERARGPCVPVPFLGRTLNAYPTLARLSKWYNVPIAVTTCRREPAPFSFTLQTHGIFEPPADDATEPVLLPSVIAALEKAILENPEQYLWSLAGGAKSTATMDLSSQAIAGLIDTGSESESCRTQNRTSSAPQTPSWAGNRPAGSAAAIEPVPTA